MDLLGRSQPLRCAPSFDFLCVIDSFFFSPVCKAGSTLFLVAAGERISTELLSCEPVIVLGMGMCNCSQGHLWSFVPKNSVW